MGGSQDTLVKEFTVIPCGAPSAPVVVSTATPVANFEAAQRSPSHDTRTDFGPDVLDKRVTPILSWVLPFWGKRLSRDRPLWH